MYLHDIAHARSGDKGNISDITVIVYEQKHFDLLRDRLTEEVVADFFAGLVGGPIQRYELSQLGALKFVLSDALDGGVTRSLSLDIHGKCFSSLLLGLWLDVDSGAGPRAAYLPSTQTPSM